MIKLTQFKKRASNNLNPLIKIYMKPKEGLGDKVFSHETRKLWIDEYSFLTVANDIWEPKDFQKILVL